MIGGFTAMALAALMLAACRSQSGKAVPEDCAPVTATLPATASAEGLAGKYKLKLVAVSGAKKGEAVEGTLDLQPHDSTLRYRIRLDGTPDSTVLHPLFGTGDIDLSAVDAVSVGSTTSRDPRQPGVLVIERHEAPNKAPMAEITMRLGSDANRRDRLRFDGAYTALRVRRVSPTGFVGAWGSGVTSERSAGYFCATRVE
jgi:hypothetical protein